MPRIPGTLHIKPKAEPVGGLLDKRFEYVPASKQTPEHLAERLRLHRERNPETSRVRVVVKR